MKKHTEVEYREQTCKKIKNQPYRLFKHAGEESRKVCEDHNLKNPLMGGAVLARFFKLPAPRFSALVWRAHDPSKANAINAGLFRLHFVQNIIGRAFPAKKGRLLQCVLVTNLVCSHSINDFFHCVSAVSTHSKSGAVGRGKALGTQHHPAAEAVSRRRQIN